VLSLSTLIELSGGGRGTVEVTGGGEGAVEVTEGGEGAVEVTEGGGVTTEGTGAAVDAAADTLLVALVL